MPSFRLAVLVILLLLGGKAATAADPLLSPLDGPYALLVERVRANLDSFYVYEDADSGFNHGFPSGFFADRTATLGRIHIDTACVDDPQALSGCSTNPEALDRARGTVLRVIFDPLDPGEFAGVNIEEPEHWGVLGTGVGYDLRGATHLVLDARSPEAFGVQFGIGGGTVPFQTLSEEWRTLSIPLSSFRPIPNLAGVHLLFTVVTNDQYASAGGTVLLDNIRLEPPPLGRQSSIGFPVATATFGVVPRQSPAPGRNPFPLDQVVRNVTTTYESALTVQALLARGGVEELALARRLADAFDYALHHDNHGNPLPPAPGGDTGLHNAYASGDLALLNDQGPGAGQAGDLRLAGFSAGEDLCGPSGFCLVLDGATGGNNAFAMLALLAAYRRFGDERYLEDVRTIAGWLESNLVDRTGSGYGGYFLGYPDEGVAPKTVVRGKSTENNADLFAAFAVLAEVEAELGDADEAARWTVEANRAGDFALAMFDAESGCFHAGTVPWDIPPSKGIEPHGPSRRGDEVINIAKFLDPNSFTALALAPSTRYRDRIDWRRPVQCILDGFARSVTAGGRAFSGFNIVKQPTAGPDGVAWEFTAQAVVLMHLVDRLYGESRFAIEADAVLAALRHARLNAPFGDQRGWVAATMQGGESLPPLEQCLSTPFQCIPERVGLAATTWGLFAEQDLNPLGALEPFVECVDGPTNLCLNGGRFKVQVAWRDHDERVGTGQAVPLTSDTGYFWFFSSANVEVIVKVLDACLFNQRFWVFAAGLTDVEVEIRVTDIRTGAVKLFRNPLGKPFQPIQDTAAFTCTGGSPL